MPTAESPAVSQQPGRWDLAELLPQPSPQLLEERIARLEARATDFDAFRSALEAGPTGERLLEILAAYEHLAEQMTVLGAFGSLWFAEDTQRSQALHFRNRIQQALTGVENRILYFTLWWKGLDEEAAQALLPAAETHPDYRHYLLDLRRSSPYTLDERSEQIINLKDSEGIETLLTVYSMLTSRLRFTLELDGGTRTMGRDELMSYVHSSRSEVREAAYRELYRVFQQEAPVLGQIYQSRVRDWYHETVTLRGFASPIAARNLTNDLPDEAVATLLEVVRDHAPLFQRYFRWKADQLGRERLRRYDLYAPVAEAERRVAYGEAVELVLETFDRFHPEIGARARRVFDERHVDAELRPGKKSGAFCATVLPRHTPWVLLNFTGRLRDVATLAHELGHAVHSLMAEDHSVLTQHPPLPLAETASVFGEMLLTDRLLAEESDLAVRRSLLATALDDAYATVMRQTFFVLFELEAHAAVLAGRSAEEIEELYLANLRQQLGDAVELTPEFRHEWLAIPHLYHTPFYCYAYSFGQLLVLSLYRRFQEEGEAFKPGYLRLLAHGGAERPLSILGEVGVDPADPAFWRSGFEVVEGMLDELEALGD